MKIYVHHNCNSCKKALKWLEDKAISVEVINLLEETPSFAEFERMTNAYDGNIKKLFNTSGQLYREMALKDTVATMSTEEVYALLNKEGMLVKRPFLLTESTGKVGFKEAEWSAIIPV